MGYKVVNFPKTALEMTMGRVAFPAFSTIQLEDGSLLAKLNNGVKFYVPRDGTDYNRRKNYEDRFH